VGVVCETVAVEHRLGDAHSACSVCTLLHFVVLVFLHPQVSKISDMAPKVSRLHAWVCKRRVFLISVRVWVHDISRENLFWSGLSQLDPGRNKPPTEQTMGWNTLVFHVCVFAGAQNFQWTQDQLNGFIISKVIKISFAECHP
jgi:hypothetical protein